MNLLDLMIKVGLEDNATLGLEQIVDNVKNVATSIGSGLAAAAKIGTAAISAAAGSVVALTNAAVDSYATYEQLVGGVETLFKNSADVVQEYAARAYQSAGLSANAYMETITSFAASMLQSLGGDTAKAAKMADQAVTDMADNANKMGTSITMIQNAYQGFAKQNYTMLDNLKLGYGGTQNEMYRLMETAASLNETFAATANFSLDAKGHLTAEFADITQAIHIVQTEMGITGTTAMEASETISGSVASMKAAWGNMLTAIADDNADFGASVRALVVSVETAFSNLVPRISQALIGVAELVTELAPEIIDAIPEILGEVVPGLVEGVTVIGKAALGAVREIADDLIKAISNVLYEFTGIDIRPLAESLNGISGLIRNTLGGILDGIDLSGTAGVVNGFLAGLADAITLVISALHGDAFEGFVGSVRVLFSSVTGSLVEHLKPAAEGIGELFAKFQTIAPSILNAVADAFGKFAGWFSASLAPAIGTTALAIVNLLKPFVDGVAVIITNIADALGGIFGHANTEEVSLFERIADAVVRLFGIFTDAVEPIISNVADAIRAFGDAVQEKTPAVERFAKPVEGLVEFFGGILENIGNIAVEISNLLLDMADLETDSTATFENIGAVAGAAAYAIADAFEDMLSRVAAALKKFAGGLENFSNFGQFKKLLDGTWVEDMVGDINAAGEAIWSVITGAKEGYDNAMNSDITSDVIAARTDIATKNVQAGSSSAAKVTEDAVAAVIQGVQGGTSSSINVNLNIDGRTAASALIDPLTGLINQRDVKVGG